MPGDDAQFAEAQGTGRFDVLHLFGRDHLPAHHTGHFHPHGQSDGHVNLPNTFAQGESDGNDHQQGRNGPHDVDQPHDQRIGLAAEITGDGAQAHSDDDGNEYGHESDGKRNARTDDHSAEQVAAVAVGAQVKCRLFHFGQRRAGHCLFRGGYSFTDVFAVADGVALDGVFRDGNAGEQRGAAVPQDGEDRLFVCARLFGLDQVDGKARCLVGQGQVHRIGVRGIVRSQGIGQQGYQADGDDEPKRNHTGKVALEPFQSDSEYRLRCVFVFFLFLSCFSGNHSGECQSLCA